MCGIAGVAFAAASSAEELHSMAKRMADAVAHRGPDDSGVWIDAESGVGLGHRRLSIVDLSPAGHQPMVSPCSRYVMVLNGEIYNYAELRRALEQIGAAPAWRGRSDTEVLLAAVSHWGLEEALRRSTGMFALAIWDRERRTLCLARDRLGEKPIYYGWCGNHFLFGSELRALRVHPSFEARLDRGALGLLLRHGYIPSPYSIYERVQKLAPGCFLAVTAAGRSCKEQPYWSPLSIAEEGQKSPFRGSDTEAMDALDGLLRTSIRGQMVADVPVGAFLSGGVDSSLVVALMQAESTQPVRTFSIGFQEAEYNEAAYAKSVARHLGTNHTELYVTPEEAQAVVPKLARIYDEPFADSSQIPTFLVAQLARKHVTVSLSGDGGDELFCGYQRYPMAAGVWQKLAWMPPRVRTMAAMLLKHAPIPVLNIGAAAAGFLLKPLGKGHLTGDRLQKAAGLLDAGSFPQFYRRMVSHWQQPEEVIVGARDLPTPFSDPGIAGATIYDQMMLLDMQAYLPGDILAKVDRAAMAVGLESRVPLLDHRVVEFACRLPLSAKLRGGESKWLLRQLLYRYVPRALIERPKMGFGVPMEAWLRGPLREWAEDLLDEQRLRQDGIFLESVITAKWKEHLSGARNWHAHLWDVLMFQSWQRSYPASA